MPQGELENSRPPRPAADRLLTLIKTGGPQTAAEMAAALGVTTEAARQQLVKMATEGVVVARAENRGVGRPTQRWNLTRAGNARFPDRHAELTVQLIRTLRTDMNERILDRLIEASTAETRTSYVAALNGAVDLRERIARLTAIRSQEGYMAEWKENEPGFLLIENHCPICSAATECQSLCRSELELFSEALGPDVLVERTEHIIAGARRCVYRIQPRPIERTPSDVREPRQREKVSRKGKLSQDRSG